MMQMLTYIIQQLVLTARRCQLKKITSMLTAAALKLNSQAPCDSSCY